MCDQAFSLSNQAGNLPQTPFDEYKTAEKYGISMNRNLDMQLCRYFTIIKRPPIGKLPNSLNVRSACWLLASFIFFFLFPYQSLFSGLRPGLRSIFVIEDFLDFDCAVHGHNPFGPGSDTIPIP